MYIYIYIFYIEHSGLVTDHRYIINTYTQTYILYIIYMYIYIYILH